MKKYFGAAAVLAAAVFWGAAAPSVPYNGPKYGPPGHPEAERLYSSHSYIQSHAAPDFWALIPYYVPQQDDRSCSVASVAMLVNAARASRELGAADELAAQKDLLAKVQDAAWIKDVSAVKGGGRGVTLDELKTFIEESLRVYGFPHAKAAAVHVDGSERSKVRLHDDLARNERSAGDFIVADFIQGVFTGDPEGMEGHIAPVGAYDAGSREVLILDPDRRYYEPYWVSEETFLNGMNRPDRVAGRNRGYVYVALGR